MIRSSAKGRRNHRRRVSERHRLHKAEKIAKAARSALGWLDDPTGGTAIGDMRQAARILRKVIHG